MKRPVCPAYAQAPIEKWCVHGKNHIVPTVSPESVITCAACPIRKLIAQIRLPKTPQMMRAMTAPKVSECVKPRPGQPRWNCTGSDALRSHGPRWTP